MGFKLGCRVVDGAESKSNLVKMKCLFFTLRIFMRDCFCLPKENFSLRRHCPFHVDVQ